MIMSDSCGCGSTVDIRALEAGQRRVLMIVLAINIASFVMMITAAIYSGSSSLLSGSLDNLGDALTYLLAIQIGWRLAHPEVPIFEAIGIAAVINLAFNALCLWLLTPYRFGDVNMSSAWECSRNDLYEGVAVLLAAAGVWLFDAGWPDLVIAGGLLLMFLRSSARVLRMAWRSYRDEVK
jgi:Co/Zn/Cd efflux system component